MYTITKPELIDTLGDRPFTQCTYIDGSSSVGSVQVPCHFGDIGITTMTVGDRFRVIAERTRPDRDVLITNQDPMSPCVLFSFLLDGGYEDRYHHQPTVVAPGTSDVFLSYHPGARWETRLPGDTVSQTVFLALYPRQFETLDSYGSDGMGDGWHVFRGLKDGEVPLGRLSHPDRVVLQSLLAQRPTQPWEWLMIESRLLGLMGSYLQRIQDPASHRSPLAFTPDESTAITRARDILVDHMENPPSIAELARRSGTNEFKLKQGFRRLYSTTVYGYLTRYRMERAFHDLSSGRMNVTETALRVGYTNPGAFAVAFKRYYGRSPRDVVPRRTAVPAGAFPHP